MNLWRLGEMLKASCIAKANRQHEKKKQLLVLGARVGSLWQPTYCGDILRLDTSQGRRCELMCTTTGQWDPQGDVQDARARFLALFSFESLNWYLHSNLNLPISNCRNPSTDHAVFSHHAHLNFEFQFVRILGSCWLLGRLVCPGAF